MAEPYYASADDLRAKLKITDEAMLPDEEAIELITEAEDLIDERLGVRGIDPETGRKVALDDYSDESWRTDKLREATLEIAKALFEDPGLASRQRARYLSGDVSTNGFYGPAYGERCEALLSASGLRANRARMSGGRRRGLRHFG
jgi:hypothetical protein